MAADPLSSTSLPTPLLRPGTVVGGRGADLEVDVDGAICGARLAIPEPPEVGDEVLVASDGGGLRYVIGVLRQLREVQVRAETKDGTKVRLLSEGGEETLRVEAADGTVLYEYSEGRSRISAPTGTLELHSASGDVCLRAAKRVRLEGAEGIDLRTTGTVRLEAGDDSALSLSPHGAKVDTDEVSLDVTRMSAQVVEEARLAADTTHLIADVVATTARRITTDADQVIERLRERYQDIAELAQTRAGSVRMVAKKTFRVLGERTLFKAKRDMKLKAKTIYLD